MDGPRVSHGYTVLAHGSTMGRPWVVYGSHMACSAGPWVTHGPRMDLLVQYMADP